MLSERTLAHSNWKLKPTILLLISTLATVVLIVPRYDLADSSSTAKYFPPIPIHPLPNLNLQVNTEWHLLTYSQLEIYYNGSNFELVSRVFRSFYWVFQESKRGRVNQQFTSLPGCRSLRKKNLPNAKARGNHRFKCATWDFVCTCQHTQFLSSNLNFIN